jgi:hypothetical protein
MLALSNIISELCNITMFIINKWKKSFIQNL